MAQMNRSMVFDLIRRKGPISRAEIARTIGLSIPTVMKITEEFSHKQFVQDVGKGESSGGKRPELLELIPDSKYIIGVGVGRSKTNVLMMNLAGEVFIREIMETGGTVVPEVWISRLIRVIENVIRESGLPEKRILGMGIGMPGILDEDSGKVLFSPDFKWENVDMLTPIRERFKMDITIENANRALAMGEYYFGAGVDSRNFLVVNLGHGIGSAIMREGEFYRGSSGSSGEIGHIILEKNGPKCNCGNKGCLEAIASGNAIARDAKIAVLEGNASKIMELVNGDINRIEAKTVFEAAHLGDQMAIQITERAMQYIGIGLANYINLLDPDLIILFGGLTNAGDIFLKKIKEVLRERQMKFAGRQVKLVISQMGENGTAVGSASLVLKKFIKYGN
ncbi:ROK family protein [Blautia producta]|uniref:ROK family protein n=3 Tax=Blautia producta TaxID=33035 RepID=A0A7G5N3P6_9FIRM|nr:ROK family protein [Blautia coccoides]QIB58778.1 ROK family transcriptional regulator [Blautia producta ATCC 27340 = DSM 2950]QMW81489.1 ROK family protein [Blautia producta]